MWLRSLGLAFVALLGMAALGFFFYARERREKPDMSHWFSCPAGPDAVMLRIPRGIGRVEVDPHLPQGAIQYKLRILDAAGATLFKQDGYFDMSQQKRGLEFEPPVQATTLVVDSCTLMVPVAGLHAWPVEIRMFGPLFPGR
jgi:hypothetical protein